MHLGMPRFCNEEGLHAVAQGWTCCSFSPTVALHGHGQYQNPVTQIPRELDTGNQMKNIVKAGTCYLDFKWSSENAPTY